MSRCIPAMWFQTIACANARSRALNTGTVFKSSTYLAQYSSDSSVSPCGPSQMIAQSRFQLGSNASGSATLVKP